MIFIMKDMKNKCRYKYDIVNKKNMFYTFLSDGSSAGILFRISSLFNKLHLSPFAIIIARLNSFINGIVIGVKADISHGFAIMHATGVVINGNVEIGKNLIVESGVVIGAIKRKSPKIGNNVFIGAGAKLLGDISIGDNVKIGANSVVIRNIPNNATVVGIPGKIIKIV
jgi:serine O-acetyltransferase